MWKAAQITAASAFYRCSRPSWRSRLLRGCVLATSAMCGLVVLLVLGPAEDASAHGLGPSASSNYRSAVTSVTPPLAGVTVRVVDDGQHIELTNTTRTPLVVLGFYGEPYLMVDAHGVWQNTRSPTLYSNRSSTALVYLPPGTNAYAAPDWQLACTCDTARWHDHRIHWGRSSAPPAVQSTPGSYHLINTWHIYARQASQDITLTGTLAWVPGPSPGPWFVVTAVAACVVVVIGFLRRWRIPLAVALVALVAVDATRTVGIVAGRSGSFGTQLQAVPHDGAVTAIFWIAALFVAGLALKGKTEPAAFGAAIVGLILALTGSVPTLAILWNSQIVSAYPDNLQRALVALTLGLGFGLLPTALLLIRRLDRQEPPNRNQAISVSKDATARETVRP